MLKLSMVGSKNYKYWMASNGMMLLSSFTKMCPLAQKLLHFFSTELVIINTDFGKPKHIQYFTKVTLIHVPHPPMYYHPIKISRPKFAEEKLWMFKGIFGTLILVPIMC
jgi:hypothetical protein